MESGHEVERYRMGAKRLDYPPLASAPVGTSGFEAAEVNTPEYDLVEIGSGPAGQKGAIAGSVQCFDDRVFNDPTLAEAYKVAAFNGLNRV